MGHPARQPFHLPNDITILPHVHNNLCDVCCRSKHCRTTFPISTSYAKGIFDMIHVDIWDPYGVSTIFGVKYFLTVVDDHNRAVWVYLMHDKGQSGNLLHNFCIMARTQFARHVKIIRSDNGFEFHSKPMCQFYSDHDIIHQTSMVDTPQQNWRVERKHHHILAVAWALCFQSSLPLKFWGKCVLTAAHLINRIPSFVLHNKTPYELLFHEKPDYSHLRVFGCLYYAHTKSSEKIALKESSLCVSWVSPRQERLGDV